MAPLIRLFALFAIFSAVLASPHVSRHVYNHAHRAIAHPHLDLESRSEPPIQRRKRSLNRRCIPRPSNATTSALSTTSSLPTSAPPVNVAPLPTLPTSSAPAPSSPAVVPTSYSSPTSPAPSTPSDTPTPSTSPLAPATSSTPPPAQTSASSSSGSSSSPSYLNGNQSGQGTYYAPGLGACGITNTASQNIAAVSHLLFDSYPGYDGVNPNSNPVCGKTVTASYQGKSVTVTITDRCTGCQTTDLDFSPNAFDTLADPSVGRINLNWVWG